MPAFDPKSSPLQLAPPPSSPMARPGFTWGVATASDQVEGAVFGYERRFGIVHVDFATQQRTPKNSAKAFQAFLEARKAG
jgi:beta-glucosidase/6-phospho-beta-glucosidase/beta-galactosidase